MAVKTKAELRDEPGAGHPAESERQPGHAPLMAAGRVARDTQKDRVYSDLRNALMFGAFAPGETVTVRSLSQRFDAGTMPVRDAVQRLVAERALTYLQTGRLRVPSLNDAEVTDLFQLRLLLETHAAATAARVASGEALASVRMAMERIEREMGGVGVSADLLAANFAFHFEIYEAAGSAQLVSIIEGLWLRFGPLLIQLMSASGADPDYRADEHVLHRRVVQALEMRDPEFTASAMRAVIQRSWEAVRRARAE